MHLVKILTNEDGEREKREWCLVQNYSDAPRTVCRGEVFGEGEGNATFKEKFSKKGGITCESCLQIIKWYKSINI